MIQVGDKIPSINLHVLGEKGPTPISTDSLFANKKVALLALPGAFTPGCSVTHLPGFVIQADTIKAKGVDSIICLSVNDAFVMGAWGKASNAEEIIMLADGNAELTTAMGLTMDASGFGMGTRSKRYSMVVDNQVVTHLNVEPAGDIGVSSAEHMLTLL